MESVSRLVAAIMRLGDGFPWHGVDVEKVPMDRGRVPPRFEMVLRPWLARGGTVSAGQTAARMECSFARGLGRIRRGRVSECRKIGAVSWVRSREGMRGEWVGIGEDQWLLGPLTQ